MSNFRENLRYLLDSKGILVKQLSEMTNIPYDTLGCYLRSDSTEPSAEKAVKIARALGVTVEYLVTGDESKSKSQKPLCREAQEVIRLAHTLNTKQCKLILNLAAEFRG